MIRSPYLAGYQASSPSFDRVTWEKCTAWKKWYYLCKVQLIKKMVLASIMALVWPLKMNSC